MVCGAQDTSQCLTWGARSATDGRCHPVSTPDPGPYLFNAIGDGQYAAGR